MFFFSFHLNECRPPLQKPKLLLLFNFEIDNDDGQTAGRHRRCGRRRRSKKNPRTPCGAVTYISGTIIWLSRIIIIIHNDIIYRYVTFK